MVHRQKVIYHNFTCKYKTTIVDYLSDNYGWHPLMMTGEDNKDMRYWKNSNHKDCILQSTSELRKAQFNYNKIGNPVPIDAEIISSLANYELNYLDSLEDSTGWNYSFGERKRFYYDILKYWNTVIHNLKPDLFVMFGWPHTPAEYPLYLLCKHHFDINILFINPVPLFDRKYHYIATSHDELYAPFRKIYESTESISPGHDVCEYLAELRGIKGKTPQYIIDTHKNEKNEKRFIRLREFVISLILTFILRRPATVAWKKNRKPYDLPASKMNHFEYFLFQERMRLRNRKLNKYYKHHCVKPDFEKKYLYFAAPYQPEATTMINGGIFEDLLLVIDILSVCIPDDWIIYYKEHPGTFLDGIGRKASLKRNSRYYEKVDSYDNVFIIPSETDSFELIDASQAVSSVSGTAVWEATVRGKPALSFGSTWYKGCKSIFSINSLHDAQNAIKMIVDGFIPDQDDVTRYAASIEKVALKGMVYRDFNKEIVKCEAPVYELIRIAEAIKGAHDNHHSGSF